MIDSSIYFEKVDTNSLFDDIELNGYSFLPPINELDCFNEVRNLAEKELLEVTYKESSAAHALLEDKICMNQKLEPFLFEYAQKTLSYKGSTKNKYKISRHVKPGKSSEAYRSHFDSHIFTIVFPILIPLTEGSDADGSLITLPKLRNDTSSNLINIGQKAYYKRYGNKKSLSNLMKKNAHFNMKFHDFRPLIFLGRTTFHCNNPLSENAEHSRITFLSHFYDRDSSLSIGNILRKLRNR